MKQISVGNYNLICFTDKGALLMEKLAALLGRAGETNGNHSREVTSLKEWTSDNFKKGNILVFIGACGIAVRAIAPFLRDKKTDPGVLVMDEKGEFVIPILSGHLGGAAAAAKEIALLTGATAVQTTATDVEGEFAVDVYAAENGLLITDMKKAKEFTVNLLKSGSSTVYIDEACKDNLGLSDIPANIKRVSESEAKLVITPKAYEGEALLLIPRCIVVGMGCKKGKTKDELKKALLLGLKEAGLDVRAVKAITSVDLKSKEEGLIELAKEIDAEFVIFDSETLMAQKGDFTASSFVKSVTGVDNVCERSVCAYGGRVIAGKRAMDGVTFAAGILEKGDKK